MKYAKNCAKLSEKATLFLAKFVQSNPALRILKLKVGNKIAIQIHFFKCFFVALWSWRSTCYSNTLTGPKRQPIVNKNWFGSEFVYFLKEHLLKIVSWKHNNIKDIKSLTEALITMNSLTSLNLKVSFCLYFWKLSCLSYSFEWKV